MKIFSSLLSGVLFLLLSLTTSAQVNNDIGISAIDSPQTLFCGSEQQIYARVVNYGSNKVDSFMLNWSISGVLQTPVKRVITLDTVGGSGNNAVSVFVANATLKASATSIIKVWTSLPNNQADPVNTNDTLSATKHMINFKGNYTIDPAGSGPVNFTSIDDAIYALESYGVCGPTVFRIAAGVYPRSTAVKLGNIPGVSSTSTITFKGSSQAACIFTGTIPYSGIIVANASKYITFRDLTIINNATDDPSAIAVVGASNKVQVINCYLKVPLVTGFSEVGVGIRFTGTANGAASTACQADSVLVDSNTMVGGGSGVLIFGASVISQNRNIRITNNKITDANDNSISVFNCQNAIAVTGNEIFCHNAGSSSVGIYFLSNQNGSAKPHLITGNKVYNFSYCGILCADHISSSVAASPTLLANNILVGGKSDPASNYEVYGIRLTTQQGTYRANVYHNTILVKNGRQGFTSDYAAFFNSGSTEVNVKNNIFAVYGGSPLPLYTSSTLTANRINNNLYYNISPSGNLVRRVSNYYHSGNYSGQLIGGDSSYNVLPPFADADVAIPDVQLTHGCLSGTDATALVPADINGNARPARPTIGAYEYQLKADNVSILDVIAPSLVQPTVSGIMDLKYRVINSGNNVLTTYFTGYRKNNEPLLSATRPVSLQPCAIDTVVFSGSLRINVESTQNVSIYTALPNNNADPARRDTLRVLVNASMKGTYTVGGTNPDFATPQLAAAAVTQKGLWGHVKFILRPGTYPGTVKLAGIIAGLGDTATITFEGTDAATTILAADTNQGAFIIDQVGYIRISNLTINNAKTGYGVAIYSSANTKGISCAISNCRINLPVLGGTSTAGAGIITRSVSGSSGSSRIDSLLIENNIITGGGYGIDINGCSDSSANKGILIRNNTIRKCNDAGIYVEKVYNPVVIRNNELWLQGNTYGRYGVWFGENRNYLVTGTHVISYNRIYNFGEQGIYCYNPNANATTAPVQIFNNEIISADSGSALYGINLTQLSNCRANVYHNTVIIETMATTISTWAAFYNTGSTATVVKNNIFAVYKGTPYAVYLAGANLASGNLDNNVYYNKVSTRLVYRNSTAYTPATYQTANGGGAQSYNAEPLFKYYNAKDDSFNLALKTSCLNLFGVNLAGQVSDDIRGVTREFIPTAGAYEFIKVINDLAVADYLLDTAMIYCPNTGYDMRYVVRNEGSNAISSYTTGYINNNAATVSMNRTISLAPCATDTVIFSGVNQVIYATRNTLQLFTRNPNNATDADPTNDTLKVKQYSALSGDYIIGAAPSDFLTFGEAISMLNKMGVCGRVDMLVKTGIYPGYFTLDSLKGSSVNNPVVFRSQAGHADSVIISNSTLGVYYVIRLRTKASNYVFENLTVSAPNTSFGGNCFQLEGSASYDTIRNCKLIQPTISGYSIASVYADAYSGTSLHLVNNKMEGGNYGIYVVGYSKLSPAKDLVVEGNVVSGFGREFMRCQYTRGARVNNNTFDLSASAVTAQTIAFSNNDSAFKFTGNIIHVPVGRRLDWDYTSSNSSPGNRSLFANNVLRGGGSIDFEIGVACRYIDIVHNSFNCNTDNVLLYMTNSLGIRFLNNVVIGSGTSALSYTAIPGTDTLISDYNLVYTSSGNTPYSMSGLKTAAAFKSAYYPAEANSISVPAGFVNTVDPSPDPSNPASWALNGKGVHIGYALNDINNNPRPQSFKEGAPDIGAYEFTPSAVPQALMAVPLSPVPGGVQAFLQGSDTIAKIKWNAAIPASIGAREYSGAYPPAINGTTHKSLNMYWEFIAPAGTYSYDLSLYYRYPLRGSIPSIANMIGAKKSGTNPWTFHQGPSVEIDSARNMLTLKGLTDFSIFTGTDVANPLPLKLIAFKAIAGNNDADVFWTTASEENVSHFEVYASGNGVDYLPVSGKIRARGSASATTAYSYKDVDAFKHTGMRYYKLRSVDYDGSVSWSEVSIAVKGRDEKTEVVVYPNPFNDRLTVLVPGSSATKVSVVSLQGELLFEGSFQPENNVIGLDALSRIAKGIYFLTIMQDGNTYTHKMIKQ